jgi:competence protein ComEA
MKPGLMFRALFEFTSTEASGVAILLPILLMVTFSGRIYNRYFRTFPVIISDTVADRMLIAIEPKPAIQMKNFDPNLVTVQELVALGIDSQLAVRLDHYRKGGGVFRKPSDLKRLYGMDTSLFRKLQPWMVINQQEAPGISRLQKPKLRQIEYDLNKSDTLDLESAPGIGKKLATRIIKYRAALGGFTDANQLYEIFGLDSLSVFAMDEFYVRSDAKPRQMNLNLVTLDQLEAHPYLSKLQARAILLYRFQHGSFKSEYDLMRVRLMDSVTLKKLRPYLIWIPAQH